MRSFHARTPKAERDYEGIPRQREPVAARDRHGLVRADALLVARGLAPSRTVAQRMIAAGRVSGPDGRIDKPSHELASDVALRVMEDDDDRYVSRGGLKLAGALARTGIDVRGKTCLDVGQSTGGFTDCLLQAGAARVVGVDVGHAQLRATLRDDPRVVCIEGVNARALERDDLGEHCPAAGFDLIVADVSFISLTLVLPQLPALLGANAEMLLLVKPQFEMGSPEAVGKGGVIRDPAVYPVVEAKLRAACAELRLTHGDWFESPIAGGDGNREFFLRISK